MKYTEEKYKVAKLTDTFDFVCENCGKPFTRTKREIQKNRGIPPKCCSQVCGRKNNDLGFIEVVCSECGKKKSIRVSEYNKSDSNVFFCDRSCAAKYNNRKYPKRHTLHKEECPICGGFKNSRSHLCRACSIKAKQNIQDKELGFYIGYGEERLKYIASELPLNTFVI